MCLPRGRCRRAPSRSSYSEDHQSGLMVGGQYGEGVLLKRRASAATTTRRCASYACRPVAQRYGYAIFFMKEQALDALTKSDASNRGRTSIVWSTRAGANPQRRLPRTRHLRLHLRPEGLMAGLACRATRLRNWNRRATMRAARADPVADDSTRARRLFASCRASCWRPLHGARDRREPVDSAAVPAGARRSTLIVVSTWSLMLKVQATVAEAMAAVIG